MATIVDKLQAHSTQTAQYSLRTEQYHGKKYIVAPVVMMVEGVHSGSRGPVFHSQQVLSQAVSKWEGMPVSIYHPTDQEGEYISANSQQAQNSIVGIVRNAYMDGDKLKAEVWLDEQRTTAVSPQALAYIRNNRELEVSVGLFTEEKEVEGTWNDEYYHIQAQSHEPDHLALLPGETGACSWDDGCGIRVNQKGDYMANDKDSMKQTLQNLKEHSLPLYTINKAGFREIAQKVQQNLDRLDSEAKMHFLYDVFEDHFVYEVRDLDSGGGRFFRQSYEVDGQTDEISFEGDPTEVRKNVEFVGLSNNHENDKDDKPMKRTKFNNNKNERNNMAEEHNTPCGDCMEKVVGLINNEQTHFTKADRGWLLELNEEQLSKLEPKKAEPVQVNREQALEALSEDMNDPEKLPELIANEDLKSQVQEGMRLHTEERGRLVKNIQTNTEEGTWRDEDLNDMGIEMLRKIDKSVRKGDYSGQGVGVTPQVNQGSGEEDILMPAGMAVES